MLWSGSEWASGSLLQFRFQLLDFAEDARVVLVAGGIDLRLDADEAVEVNPVGGGAPIAASNPFGPRSRKRRTGDVLEKVNSIGRQADLHNLVSLGNVEQQRAAELDESTVGTTEVFGGGLDPQINVFREARFGVVDECQAADDEVADTVTRQQGQHVLEVVDGLHGRSGSAAFDGGQIGVECHERGEALFRCLALPKLKIPTLSLGEVVRTMGNDNTFATLCSLLEAHDTSSVSQFVRSDNSESSMCAVVTGRAKSRKRTDSSTSSE